MKRDLEVVDMMAKFYEHPKTSSMLKPHKGHDVQLQTGMTTGASMWCETCEEDVCDETDLKEAI